MIVRETSDINEIKAVLCTPEIYECINDDRSGPSEEFEPPMDATYIGGYVDGNPIAIMIYHEFTGKLKCHIQVLPEYRKQYAKEFARMALEYGKVKNVDIYAEIPTCYQNVINFAKSFDFHECGVIKDDCIKDGVKYDVIILRLDHGTH